ncbi:MAG: glycosyltransferase family 1 protein [Actinomycetia bacterium]|nr:glycosyltransferase family 1 protein [Actinomycetes bacterium]
MTLRRPVPRHWRAPDSKLRVAVIAESFLPAVNGVTNSVLRLIEYLRAEGHEVMVIAPGPGSDNIDGTPVVRVRAIDLPRYDSLRVGLPVVRLTSMLRSFKPDVVHLAAPTVLGAAGVRAARLLDVPSVAVFQTDLAGFAGRYGLGMADKYIWRWLRVVHNQASLTLAPSTSAIWTLQTNGIERVQRWARGVDLVRFHPEHRSAELRKELAPLGETIVGFVGRLAKEKQVNRLAPITQLPGVKVVVVGDGPEKARLERQLPDARFVGFQGGAALSAYHASFDVFAHTGLDETFCQAVQEALASGVPVVAPAAGGPLDLVTHGTNGYLWSPEQPGMLTGAVAELAASPLRRVAMGDAGRASVIGRSWSVVMGELVDHYRALISPTVPSLRVPQEVA